MNNIKNLINHPTESSAQIISRNEVEVIAPDGEVFTVYCGIGSLLDAETRNTELKWLEILFDQKFSLDKEYMIQNIWHEMNQFGLVKVLAISAGSNKNRYTHTRDSRRERN